MDDEKKCADCNRASPETATPYTLISAQHGWRLSRLVAPDGTQTAEWRCPVCWRAYRARLDGTAAPADLKKEAEARARVREARSVVDRMREAFAARRG